MCGVWAQINFNKKASPDSLMFPLQALSHRGPDGYGWVCQDEVLLLHTRLSIIDLSGGHQPLKSFDGRFWGIVNGELYDYEKHRDRLESEGITFKTRSDSEVLLNLFAYSGAQSLEKLSGEYAFIFYDQFEKKIYFGRDMHGVKPLFWQRTNDRFTLSSELKALSDEVPELDEVYIKRFLARAIVPPRTALKDCFHVMPGRVYCFDVRRQEMTSVSYQKLPLFQNRSLKKEAVIEAAYDTLKQAVQRRLVADVEVGCYLSGGIDSALIAAMAVECGAKPKAFTVGFADVDFDETAKAARIAQHLGIEHHTVQLNGKNFFDSLTKSIVAFENPISNPHGAAKNILAKMASQHVKVVLTGEGADEWFGGYAYLRFQKLRDFFKSHPGYSQRSIRLLSEQEHLSLGHLNGKSDENDKVIRSYFNGLKPAVLSRLSKHRLFEFLTGDKMPSHLLSICGDLKSLFNMDFEGQDESTLLNMNTAEWDLNTWASIRTDLLHYILANVGDRQEMAFAIEGRTPFMDRDVIQLAGQIHPSTLMRALTEKSVLRGIAKRLLPDEVSQRKKHPFFAPMKYMFMKESRATIADHIQIAKKHSPWLNWKNIEHFLENTPRMPNHALAHFSVSLRLTLFSMAVLVQQLRTPALQVKGYNFPSSTSDLLSFNRGMNNELWI
ncbi:MAG: asparagine synthase (glutamine-hydrolyzing) [Pseudobdellovibrionaceae bacterium]